MGGVLFSCDLGGKDVQMHYRMHTFIHYHMQIYVVRVYIHVYMCIPHIHMHRNKHMHSPII